MTIHSRPHELFYRSDDRTLEGKCAEIGLAAAYAFLGEESGVRTYENKV